MPNFCSINKTQLLPDEKDFLEVARYLGYSKISVPDNIVLEKIHECAIEMHSVICPSGVYEEFELIDFDKDGQNPVIHFADIEIESQNLAVNFKGCSAVVLMAATIGPKVDALIRRSQSIDPVKSAVFQACGAMFIEKTVDLINKEINQKASDRGFATKPRYSPGYGDVPLSIQSHFFRLLPCSRIGLTLMDTMIMAPEKSVTAFIGIKK